MLKFVGAHVQIMPRRSSPGPSLVWSHCKRSSSQGGRRSFQPRPPTFNKHHDHAPFYQLDSPYLTQFAGQIPRSLEPTPSFDLIAGDTLSSNPLESLLFRHPPPYQFARRLAHSTRYSPPSAAPSSPYNKAIAKLQWLLI